ncbi:MAG TPA: hypothetical protein PK420_08610 [Rubrivivax sp.]|nr:hypothetical protein [Rubrivivax sp.]
MTCTTLAAVLPVTEYRAKRAHIYPSDGSIQWYMRQHRAALVEAGALLLIGGRHFIQADKFDAYVIGAGSVAAAARSQGGAS